jgi:predicted transcriptional regulator
MPRRINARIDDELAKKLAALERVTGQETSTIIKLALDAYIEHWLATTAAPEQGLADFIGCADGDRELSSRYKHQLRDSWGSKT